MLYYSHLVSKGVCFLSILLFCQFVQAEDIFEKPLSVLDKWVGTENAISKEKFDWEIQKASIADLIEVHQEELSLLNKQIEESEGRTTEADRHRAKLLEDEDALKKVSASVAKNLIDYENQIRVLIARVPLPLQQEIDPLFDRIPQDSTNTHLGISQRMQNIVGILTQIDKFNNSVVPASEFRVFEDDGNRIEVKILYFGLGVGYYADASGKHAGYTYPGEKKWEWQEDNELASSILNMLRIYESSAADARFIPLPVTIR